MKRAWWALVTGWTLLAATLPAWAQTANPVVPDTRSLQSENYDGLASRLGFREWGSASHTPGAIHVLYRVSPLRESLAIAFPANTNPQQVSAWFPGLAQSLGWGDADLTINATPEYVMVRALHRPSTGQGVPVDHETGLDLETLRSGIARVSAAPVLLGGHAPGEIQQLTPAPHFRGEESGDTYFYYRLDAATTATPFHVRYGVSRRWFAAMGVALLLWLVFPPLVFLALREHLRSQEELKPVQRLTTYRRWQSRIASTASIGSFVTYFVLGRNQLSLLLGSALMIAPLALMLLPQGMATLAGKLIGLPLQWDAAPTEERKPWHQTLSSELWIFGLATGGMLLVVLLCTLLRGGSITTSTFLYVLFTFLALWVGVPLAVGFARARLAQRRRQAPAPVPGASAPLSPVAGVVTAGTGGPFPDFALPGEDRAASLQASLAALAERLGEKVPEVLIPPKEGIAPLMVTGGKATIPRKVFNTLDADQLAALVVAEDLAQPRSRMDRFISYYWLVSLVPLALVIFYFVSRLNAARTGGGTFPFYFPVILLSWIPSSLATRYQQRRQDAADTRVAEALTDPRTLIQALRRYEEVQWVAGDMTNARHSLLARRRTRLERRLGLE